MVAVVEQLRELGLDEVDRARVVFEYCGGAFSDFPWFRETITFVADPHRRVRHLTLEGDWWYADDLAPYYFDLEKRNDILHRELGRRIHVPAANGDGGGLAFWLEHVVSRRKR